MGGTFSFPVAQKKVDLQTDLVEIAQGTYWVGKRSAGALLHCNSYLRVFKGTLPAVATGQGNLLQEFYLLVDPGPASDLAVVRAKVEQCIGRLDRLSAVYVNHQDPDVGSSLSAVIGRYAPHASVIASEETWRFIQYYGLPREQFVDVGQYLNGLPLPTGHTLRPVASRYCHFVGAVMLYDIETRVLFSGDLFGGLTAADAEGLYADETDWTGIRAFHQVYMPANKSLVRAIAAIRALDPPVEIIAPQHGRVLQGPVLLDFLDRMETLQVGLDIAEDETDESTLTGWTTVLGQVLELARSYMGNEADERLQQNKDLRDYLRFDGEAVSVQSLGRWTVEQAVETLTAGQPDIVSTPLKFEAIVAAEDLDLPTPALVVDEEG